MHLRASGIGGGLDARRRFAEWRIGLPLTLGAAGLAASGLAAAHEDPRSSSLTAAMLDAVLGICLTAACVLYAIGLVRVWRRAGIGCGIRPLEAMCFSSGAIVLAWALFGSLDALARGSFALHMVQHELLMVVAAPLLVLGRPLGAWSWAVPMAARRSAGKGARARWFSRAWRVATAPLAAWCLHTIALWVWHTPELFRAASADDLLHALQHSSFLLSALLFWRAVLANASARPGVALLLLFTTMVHTGALGALLVFSPADWYAVDAARGQVAELQLGGLIMWIPSGTVYVLAALMTVHRLLATSAKPTRLSRV